LRTGGREKLGAYACDINSKVEVSVIWGSLVPTEHFIRYSFAFCPPRILIWELLKMPVNPWSSRRGYSQSQDECKTFRGKKNEKEKYLNAGKSMSKSVTETQKKPIIHVYLGK